MKGKNLRIRVDDFIYLAVKEISDRTNKSVSVVVRALLTRVIDAMTDNDGNLTINDEEEETE